MAAVHPAPLALLDLDGTLVDSAGSILASLRDAYAAVGQPVPDEARLRTFLGPPIAGSFAANGMPADLVPAAVVAYRRVYDSRMLDAPVYPGTIEALTTLRGAGVRMVLATSKPEVYAARICDRTGLTDRIDAVAGASLDGSRTTKAQVVARALDLAGPHVGARVMVGDRRHDVAGAAEHGIGCVGAGWGYAPVGELACAGAVAVAATPEELPGLVLAQLAA